ncbi:MAG: efflux RND transporter periplasmic adaptor subunit [Planctomyces sp.]|nr:efflux RND transporter periplasmic adaptor subunit [Planctomyces sp.]
MSRTRTRANVSDHCQSVVLSCFVCLLFAGCGAGQGGPGQGGPPGPGGAAGKPVIQVKWTTPKTKSVTEYEEFTGRTAAVQSIELRSRVTGYLEKVHFEDGMDVKAGDELFSIDQRQFVQEELQSKAMVDQMSARVNRLKGQVSRTSELREKGAVSIDDFEALEFDLNEATAALMEASAAHELAKLNLDYTKIRAPISGRIGRNLVDAGNIVIQDQTALANIVPLDTLHVYFDIDERTVLKMRRRQLASGSNPANAMVQISLADSDEFKLSAKVDFLDNQIDAATGTLRVRALLDNPSGMLAPGLFVRVRFPLGEPEELLMIPESSIGSSQGDSVVYIVQETGDGMMAVRLDGVEFGPLVEFEDEKEALRAVRSGVKADDRVITTGLHRLKNNAAISKFEDEPRKEPSADQKPAPAPAK